MKNKKAKLDIFHNNLYPKDRKAAMEMSVGTIVTIVLLMSMLVLGLVLINTIFDSATGAIDKTDQQINKEIERLFSEDKKVVVYPTDNYIEIKVEEVDEVGVRVKNLGKTVDAGTKFEYTVETMENNCGLDDKAVMNWIQLGSSGKMTIPINDYKVGRIRFQIPAGTPLCLARFDAIVELDGVVYGSQDFDVQIQG